MVMNSTCVELQIIANFGHQRFSICHTRLNRLVEAAQTPTPFFLVTLNSILYFVRLSTLLTLLSSSLAKHAFFRVFNENFSAVRGKIDENDSKKYIIFFIFIGEVKIEKWFFFSHPLVFWFSPLLAGWLVLVCCCRYESRTLMWVRHMRASWSAMVHDGQLMWSSVVQSNWRNQLVKPSQKVSEYEWKTGERGRVKIAKVFPTNNPKQPTHVADVCCLFISRTFEKKNSS